MTADPTTFYGLLPNGSTLTFPDRPDELLIKYNDFVMRMTDDVPTGFGYNTMVISRGQIRPHTNRETRRQRRAAHDRRQVLKILSEPRIARDGVFRRWTLEAIAVKCERKWTRYATKRQIVSDILTELIDAGLAQWHPTTVPYYEPPRYWLTGAGIAEAIRQGVLPV